MGTKTRRQEVGTCSICGRRCAVRHGRVSVHGYQKTGMGFFTGECLGSGRPHYGSNLATKTISAVIGLLDDSLRHGKDKLKVLELNLSGLNISEQYLPSQIKQMRKEVAQLKGNGKAIPEFIDFLKGRIGKWELSATEFIEVDSQGRSKDEIKKAQAERELKKSAKEIELKKKQDAANERALRAEKVKAEYEALIKGENYYRLFFKGELIESFVSSFESEQAIYERFNSASKAHWDKVSNGDSYDASVFGFFYGDGRTAKDGKGKRFFEHSYYVKEKEYFARYK